MTQFVKFNSRQGVINANNNLVDFDIPPDAVYDLTKSYVNIMCSLEVSQFDLTGAVVANPTPNPYFITRSDLTTPAELFNIVFVKNYEFKNQQDGTLEYIRNVDVLTQHLNTYMFSEEEKKSVEYRQINRAMTRNNVLGGLNVELNGEGAVPSRNLNVFPVKLPLSQLGSMGLMSTYDSTKKGNTRLHLELNLDKLICRPVYFNDQNDGSGVNYPVNNFTDVDTITAGVAVSVTGLTITNTPKVKSDSPYFVGQKLVVTFSVGGGTDQLKQVVVTQIDFINTDNTPTAAATDLGKIKLTLDQPVVTLASGDVFTGKVDYCNYDNVPLKVERAELVLHRYNQTPAATGPVSFRTFTTEQFNAGGTTRLLKNFEVEPNAMNLLVLNPSNGPVCVNTGQTTYRISVDNIPTTDRVVPTVQSPLYNDKLVSGFVNMGKNLKSLVEFNKDITKVQEQPVQRLLTIIEPLAITNNIKLVQLDFEDSTGLNNINLYKQVLKQML